MANLIRLKQIESGSALQVSAEVGADFSASVNDIVSQSIQTTFSASIVQIITNNVGAVLPDGVISSSAQLDGTTFRNITIAPINSDGYSLIVSGALGVVDATNLSEGGFGDMDSTVPGQISVNGQLPSDPSTNNTPLANVIDQGEW